VRSRRGAKTKAKQQRHAAKRLWQRFSLAYTPAEIEQITRQIRDGKSTPLRRVSLRLAVHKVTVAGQEMAAYYDTERHALVTVKPLEWEGPGKQDE
jgi:ATPase subunit of ABC transporter with duplicated ATPase domains